MKRWLTLVAIIATGTVSLIWNDVAAQQAAPPGAPDPSNFTGKVTVRAADDVRVLRLVFEPSARTNWHSHAGGQTLIVEQGRLRAAERGASTGKEFGPGESYVTAPNIVHWHGALPDGPLTQVAVSFGTTKWLEPVTAAQYNAAARR